MASTPHPAPKDITVLIVEDSPTQLQKLRFLLEDAGFAVVSASDGALGLAAARANPIDLVISDIVMPGLDGYGLCKALRADEALRHLPVILLTSLGDPQDVIQGLECGANNFICKPYDDRALLARVRNVIANREIRKTPSSEMGISVLFHGQRFLISADRLQVLDLLLSTYENAVSRNGELLQARDELRLLNEELESRVAERTAALLAEIDERKRAQETHARLSTAVEQSAEAILITDASGTIVYANPAFAKSTGYTWDETIGQNPRFLKSGKQDAEFYREMWDVLARGEVWRGRIVNKKKDGTLFTEDATISPVRDLAGQIANYVAAKRDVTNETLLEGQLLQAQKMEAVGRLAAGVAHDFNNLLGVITGYGEIIHRRLPDEDPLKDKMAQILRAGERAADLTRQLLAFGRKQVLQPKILDLNVIVSSMQRMLPRVIGEDIDLMSVLDPHLGRVRADPGQIDQILMNLAVNARDAMPEGGRITIETSNVDLEAGYASTHAQARTGPHVMLAVSDTGIGMDAETQARAFEPFFTTKSPGEGTGLGLSTVHGIVRQSDGHVRVYSEAGVGTTFKIYLPRIDEEARSVQEAAHGPLLGGTETVLLVEDEASLREMLKEVLEANGYSIVVARNGAEALQMAASHVGPIPLMVTDVIMPGMTGVKIADLVAAARPQMKVLFVSGYSDEAVTRHGLVGPGRAFLSKPFGPEVFLRKVRESLDAVGPAERE